MAPSPGSGMIVWTEPLPNDWVPMTIARRWSCRAPATISDAEAEPPLISTTIGRPSTMSPGRALKRWMQSGPAAAGRDDLALVDEGVGHRHRLVEQAAGIVAQVEHDAGQLVADLALQLLDRLSRISVAVCSLKVVSRI